MGQAQGTQQFLVLLPFPGLYLELVTQPGGSQDISKGRFLLQNEQGFMCVCEAGALCPD